MREATFVAIDGGAVAMTSSMLNVSGPVTSHSSFVTGDRKVSLAAGPRGEQQMMLELGAGIVLDRSIRHSGGDLLLGEGDVYGPNLEYVGTQFGALWQGPWHEIALISKTDGLDWISDTFARVEFIDSEGGASVRPRIGHSLATYEARPPRLTRVVDPIGPFTIQPLTPALAQRIPRWQGAPTQNGELYADEKSENSFVLVSESAYVTILARDPYGDSTTEQIQSVGVSWEYG